MAAFSAFAGVAITSTTIALSLAFRKILNPKFEYGKDLYTDDQNNPLIMACRWFSGPIAAVASAFCVALRPQLFHDALPSMFATYVSKLHKVLPLHPLDLQEAFDLGSAYRALVHEGNHTYAMEIAQRIANRAVSEEEIRQVPQRIAEALAHQGIVSRVLSAFSIVNIVWFIAILGLTATVGPFVYTLLKPLRGLLYELSQRLLELLTTIAKRLSPLAETALYSAAVYLFVEASRYAAKAGERSDAYSMVGPMSAVTSIAVFGLAWAYTTAQNSNNSGNVELFMTLTWSLASLFCLPAAQIHQSRLLGYGTVVAATAALGFSGYSSGLCTMIGFRSKDALIRGAFGCGAMTAAAFAIRFFELKNSWTDPLMNPLSVFGTTIYLLALDIYAFSTREGSAHGFYVANLIAIVSGGHMLGLEGAANVAKSFGGLFLFTLYCEARPHHGESFVIWLFFLFAILYAGSLHLSRNPELMLAIMQGGLQ